MFGLKRNPELHEVMAGGVALKGKPQPFIPTFGELEDLSEYQEVANVLGFNPPQIEEQRVEKLRRELIGFMLDQGFPIYNNAEVHAYMAKLAEKDGKVFCWARLDQKVEAPRPRPSETDWQAVYEDQLRRSLTNWRPGAIWAFDTPHTVATEEHGQIVPTKYARPVPLDILKRAAAVKKQFPAAAIHVSDYAVVNPDPFIMAKLGACAHVVFGVWDEPGFKAIGRDRDPA